MLVVSNNSIPRKPHQRFLEIARGAEWSNFPAVRRTFRAADCTSCTGTLIFDIGGSKCRLVAREDFEEQLLYIQAVLTHEENSREHL